MTAALAVVLVTGLALLAPAYANEAEPPQRPAGLVVTTERGALAASVDWDDVAGATHYLVRWRAAGAGNPLNEGLTVDVSAADVTVADYGDWVVRVEACHDGGCGLGAAQRFRVEREVEPPPVVITPPLRPAALRVTTEPGALEVSVGWDDVAGATHYRLRWRRFDGGFLAGDDMTVTATGASFTVSDYGLWAVRLEGCNAAGCGPGIARTVGTTPAAPANLAVSAAPGELTLSAAWDAAAGASSYRLRWRRFDGGFLAGNEAIVTATSASFAVSDHGLWAVRLEGCNAAGCGPGIARTVTTAPPEPPPVVMTPPPLRPSRLIVTTEPGVLEVSVDWDDVAGATHYRVQQRAAGAGNRLNEGLTVDVSAADVAVADYGDWVVRVEACHDGGCGLGAVQRFRVEREVEPPPAVTTPGSPCSSPTVIPDPTQAALKLDCEALWASRTVLDPAVEVLTNWNASTPLESWTGVTLGGSPQRVTRLLLAGQFIHGGSALKGTIPAQLGSLDKLTHLDLQNNLLRGKIPGALGRLTNLVDLFLNVNVLEGRIPARLGNLTNLRNLYVGDNQLRGSIPSELGNLTNLRYLFANTNHLRGRIPPELGKLPNVEYLFAKTNGLSGSIPVELANLSTLRFLDFADNELTGSIPPELSRLTRLREIYLRNNQLEGPIPAALGSLPYLYTLNLQENGLTGPVPAELGNLPILNDLDLSDNQLTGSIPDLSRTLMGHLDLRNNSLTGNVPAWLGTLPHLDTLYLSGNELTGCLPAALASRSLSYSDLGETGLHYCAQAPTPEPAAAAGVATTSVAGRAGAVSGLTATAARQGMSPQRLGTDGIAAPVVGPVGGEAGGARGNNALSIAHGSEVIRGSRRDDELQGGPGDDRLDGGNGDDTLNGNDGDDVLEGGAGDDELDGGRGDDELEGGPGDDTYTGGPGADRFVLTPWEPGDEIITDFEDGDRIVLSGADHGLWPNAADILASEAPERGGYVVYTLRAVPRLTVETDVRLEVRDFVLE